MADTPAAYPLAWPHGWNRTPPLRRRDAAFRSGGSRVTLVAARERLQDELDRLGAKSAVLSTNLELRLDGWPRGGQAAPSDPGAACYFTLRRGPVALACDRWTTVAGNIAAIAAHIGALRGMERWGVGNVEQAFAGYARLPAPMVPPEPWWHVLGFAEEEAVSLNLAEAAFRSRMRQAHPDAGGSHEVAARLNAAISEAREVLS